MDLVGGSNLGPERRTRSRHGPRSTVSGAQRRHEGGRLTSPLKIPSGRGSETARSQIQCWPDMPAKDTPRTRSSNLMAPVAGTYPWQIRLGGVLAPLLILGFQADPASGASPAPTEPGSFRNSNV